MTFIKPVGPAAASRKYDLLTGMGALALSSPQGEQRLILRLMVVLTARYNWASDTLAIGQEDLARLWSVDPRTVKRAMAEYRRRGWLILKRAAARGRVAQYAVGLERLMADTRPVWPCIGSDFVTRHAPAAAPPVMDKVIPFPVPAGTDDVGAPWVGILRLFARQEPALFQTWLASVRQVDCTDGVLTLTAPGRFRAAYLRTHLIGRLLAIARTQGADIHQIDIICDD